MHSNQLFCDSTRAAGFARNARQAPPLAVVPTTPRVCYSTADLVSELAQLAAACGEPDSIGLPLCAESGLRVRLWRDNGTGECSVEIVEARDDDA